MNQHCGRMYDPGTDEFESLLPCRSSARWQIVTRDGLVHWACGMHINTVLHDIVGDQFTDLAIKDLWTDG
jgi:hypothetical protein